MNAKTVTVQMILRMVDPVAYTYATTQKGEGQCVLELREMHDFETNALKERSLRAVLGSHPNLKLWIHDLVCRAKFADGLVPLRMPDKFHRTNHTIAICKTTYNPRTPTNKRILKKFGVLNTQKAEQIWGRVFNRHYNT